MAEKRIKIQWNLEVEGNAAKQFQIIDSLTTRISKKMAVLSKSLAKLTKLNQRLGKTALTAKNAEMKKEKHLQVMRHKEEMQKLKILSANKRMIAVENKLAAAKMKSANASKKENAAEKKGGAGAEGIGGFGGLGGLGKLGTAGLALGAAAGVGVFAASVAESGKRGIEVRKQLELLTGDYEKASKIQRKFASDIARGNGDLEEAYENLTSFASSGASIGQAETMAKFMELMRRTNKSEAETIQGSLIDILKTGEVTRSMFENLSSGFGGFEQLAKMFGAGEDVLGQIRKGEQGDSEAIDAFIKQVSTKDVMKLMEAQSATVDKHLQDTASGFGVFTAVLEDFKAQMGESMNEAFDKETLDDFASALKSIAPVVAIFAKGMAYALLGPIEFLALLVKGTENAADFLSESLPKIGTFFSDLSASAYNWGSDLITGFMDGISNKFSALKDTLGSFTDTVKNSVTEALGIHSPSRVMMEYGEDTSEGFALGVEKEKPLVDNSLQKSMANPAKKAGDSSTSNAMSVTSHNTFNINGAQNPKAVQDQIAASFESMFTATLMNASAQMGAA